MTDKAAQQYAEQQRAVKQAAQNKVECSDCRDGFSRRDFVKFAAGSALAVAAAPMVNVAGFGRRAFAAPTPSSAAETSVKRFYDSLNETQRQKICFAFDNPLRQKINANWQITDAEIDSDFYTLEQRENIKQIFKGVTSEEGYERFLKQMEYDAGGFGAYSVAVFGEPGTGKFQWELTGRHLTIRADGDSVDKAAFGGPIVYGHGEEDPAHNIFHYQTKAANEVFHALDEKQRAVSLLAAAPNESAVALQGDKGAFPGVAVGDLSSDQKDLVEKVVKVILAPYRSEDVDEALAILKAGGGFDKLHMAFYKQEDLNSDQVWDIWRVEGPSFVWHFRGAPHVHTYVNIGLLG
jgi:hypothetical protein